MAPFEMIKRNAQYEADRTGKAVMILNIDRYVIRDFDDSLLFSDFLVAIIEPEDTP